jgi:type I restriction enzyme S subunit
MKFGLPDSTIENIQKVFENNSKIDEVIVFGSRAKGNYKDGSDIDLAAKGRNIDFKDILRLSGQLDDLNLPYTIDLLDYATINDKDLIEHIDIVGIVFYERWKKYKLEEICTAIVSGGTPLTSISDYYKNGTISWVKTKEVLNNKIFDTEHKITELGLTNSSAKLIPKNSIIIAMYGDGDTAGRVAINKIPLATNQACGNLIINKQVANYEFVFYYLLNSYEDLVYLKSGSGQQNLNLKTLKEYLITLPPPQEQTAIACIFSSLDDKIDLLHRQNKILEQLAETLFRQWFVEEADEGCEVGKISDFAYINNETFSRNYPFTQIEYLDTGSITAGSITNYQTYNLIDAPSRAQRIVKNDDIVYSLVRPIQRHYGLLHDVKSNTIASTGFCVVTTKGISPYFLYLLLTRNDAVDYFDMVAEGSTSAYPSLKPSDIANYEFQMPPEEKLSNFSNFSYDTWNKIKSNTNQIKSLIQLRDALLPKLMSGEVRVS